MPDACSSTTVRMTPCKREAVGTVGGRSFCAKHGPEAAGIMDQPLMPLPDGKAGSEQVEAGDGQ